MRIFAYIDGFNLYYGLKEFHKRGYSCKWLDLNKLCEFYNHNNSLTKIKYFTANVKPRIDDLKQPLRQQIYFRALETLPNIEIIKGGFQQKIIKAPLVEEYSNDLGQIARQKIWVSTFVRELKLPLANFLNKNKYQYALIHKSEEKGSDVNLATNLLNDAHLKLFDKAIVISNDSDLAEAIKIVKNQLKLQIMILNPHKKNCAFLKGIAPMKIIRAIALTSSQFPTKLTDKNGNFSKPQDW